jgi:hypothetical protein
MGKIISSYWRQSVAIRTKFYPKISLITATVPMSYYTEPRVLTQRTCRDSLYIYSEFKSYSLPTQAKQENGLFAPGFGITAAVGRKSP